MSSIPQTEKKVQGLSIDRRFTDPSKHPYDNITWEKRTAQIVDANGKVIFEQEDVEAPQDWSQTATNITASKYFYGKQGSAIRESSVRQMIDRVVSKIVNSGYEQGYFAGRDSANTFSRELTYLLVNQYAAFNSPVWFNVGCDLYEPQSQGSSWHYEFGSSGRVIQSNAGYSRPQCSACFINSVEDSMESIMELARTEAMLFKYGSGTGTNLSPLRSSKETVSGGGVASGPLSFMRGYDAFAGVIKSGGKTRRAAKMVMLNVDHPDVEAFIECKSKEEEKAFVLMAAGYDGSGPDSEAYSSIFYQNSNNSVRVSDTFMQRATDQLNANLEWELKAVKDGRVIKTVKAHDLLHKMAEAAWRCGDPGIQFDTTINHWHTCDYSGRINASNPCCLVGPTLTDTSEGKIRIDVLEKLSSTGQVLPLSFAWDFEQNLPVLRPIKKVWKAGETRELAAITTQRGHVFLCTPEHHFYLYDGTQVAARDLKFDDRLRKINRTVNQERSGRKSILHRITPGTPNGCEYQARWMWEQAYGAIPEGKEVHHCNEDATDDRLSNFELLDLTDHRVGHAAGSANSRYLAVEDQVLIDTWEAVALTPKHTHRNGPSVTPSRWNKYVVENSLVGRVPLARGDGRIRGMEWDAFHDWVEGQMAFANDRIQSVEIIQLEEPVPVYDMEVEGTHNFAITSGDLVHSIIVHNSEYMFLDDTACNLASLNLTKFLSASGKFDTERFTSAVEIMILAQDILVDMSGYPTERIARNSHDYRPLGLGYANLGALLMALGIPYDSDEGRSWAACITSIMTGVAYAMSARIAGAMKPLVPCGEATFKEYSSFMTSREHAHRNGACPGWFLNKQSFSRVMLQHRDAAVNLPAKGVSPYLREAAEAAWHRATGLGLTSGFRNAQVTVLAPTGTIGFLMDCDTTGIEPELALVKYKKLVGGGLMKIVNEKVSDALFKLGFHGVHVDAVLKYISETGTIEGAPFIKDEHLPVFDCSFRPQAGKRSIAWSGHIAMMAAVQPFLSGAISKTVNMPEESTVEDVEQAYIQAWVRGLKSIAIYRDGSKRNQVLTTKRKDALKMENLADLIQKKRDEIVAGSAPDSPLRDNWGADQKMADPGAPPPAIRHRLPDERQAVTHKFNVSGHEGYVTIGLYANGEPGEMFIQMAKEGSTISGLMDAFATMVSVGLQHGVPLQTLIGKFGHMRFEPSGWSHHPGIGYAKSLMDYIFRWLDLRFVKGEQTSLLPAPPVLIVSDNKPKSLSDDIEFGDSPSCQECGAIMVRSGSCYKCLECGSTSGCS